MAQSLMAGMRLKYFIKEKDPDHVISWRDFLKFFSIAVRRYPKKRFPNDKMTSFSYASEFNCYVSFQLRD